MVKRKNIMSAQIHRLTHYADVLAIPMFLAIAIILTVKHEKTRLELVIMVFAWIGFLFDTVFTINYFWVM
jgi:hypothetical protein